MLAVQPLAWFSWTSRYAASPGPTSTDRFSAPQEVMSAPRGRAPVDGAEAVVAVLSVISLTASDPPDPGAVIRCVPALSVTDAFASVHRCTATGVRYSRSPSVPDAEVA